jgi:hypothetical protein
MENFVMNRRASVFSLVAIAAGGLFPAVGRAAGDALPAVKAYRNPGCGCCEKWAGLMKAVGFSITMEDDDNLARRKTTLGVPENLAGCHTALIGNYVFEGHVPPADIVQFLSEKPDALGLSVPGMPMGSPGMEVDDQKDAYDVLLMKKGRIFTVYKSYS